MDELRRRAKAKKVGYAGNITEEVVEMEAETIYSAVSFLQKSQITFDSTSDPLKRQVPRRDLDGDEDKIGTIYGKDKLKFKEDRAGRMRISRIGEFGCA